MKRNSILVVITVLLFSHNLFADSPLTSTSLAKAYADVKIVKLASKTDGKLTKRLMKYLNNRKKPIDVKIALINKLGWDFDGKNNSDVFFQFLKEKKGFDTADEFLNQANADLLICMAYLKALDNYFDVSEAIAYAGKAKSKNRKSYTINIIYALIRAQKAMNSNWCRAYRLVDDVRMDKSLNKDMKDTVIDIIFEYMDLYRDDCE